MQNNITFFNLVHKIGLFTAREQCEKMNTRPRNGLYWPELGGEFLPLVSRQGTRESVLVLELQDLNLRPPSYQDVALPGCAKLQFIVDPDGIEPPTSPL